MATLILSLTIVLGPLGSHAAGQDGRRVALLIGNGDYRNVGQKLPNPVHDARAMAGLLRELGFEVIEGIDLDYRGMRQVLRDFERRLLGADAGLFFYAGHGMEFRGGNYLFPTDAELETEGDISFGLVDLDLVVSIMENSVPVRLLFLDACRNNPLARRFRGLLGPSRSAAVGRGLARVEAGEGTFIAYATAPGEVAEDGEGENSPFTHALLQHLGEPGLDIRLSMDKVRRSVRRATSGRQLPWESSSLLGSFVFRGTPQAATVAAAIPSPDEAMADEPGSIEARLDLLFWESIKDSTDPADFEAYVTEFGDSGRFILLARKRAGELAMPGSEQPADAEAERPQARVQSVDLSGAPAAAGMRFRDCPECPEMVVVPAGEFMLGASDAEHEFARSAGASEALFQDELPRRRISLVSGFAVARTEVTLGQFREFVRSTARDMNGSCEVFADGRWVVDPAISWQEPGYPHGDDHPVGCVNLEDAEAYAQWLADRTGRPYRLLSESEWEYAARAGSDDWPDSSGRDWSTEACLFANALDRSAAARGETRRGMNCDDGFAMASPVASFRANEFGLHDMLGNVWEWVADCYVGNHSRNPGNGAPYLEGECKQHVVRGGSWQDGPENLRISTRFGDGADDRYQAVGFRVALSPLAP
ncbi:MAG: SUMF1/EgtB/PvdO family nonheme iron enzyme [Geminicoccaceae bacterium]